MPSLLKNTVMKKKLKTFINNMISVNKLANKQFISTITVRSVKLLLVES